MKKIIILMLFVISCSPPTSFNDDSDSTSEKNENFSSNEKVEEFSAATKSYPNTLSGACKEGCLYYYRIFKTIKEVNKNSISLTSEQIQDFDDKCSYHCSEHFESNKGKVEVLEPFPESKVFKKQEKKKRDKGDLTPFEDL